MVTPIDPNIDNVASEFAIAKVAYDDAKVAYDAAYGTYRFYENSLIKAMGYNGINRLVVGDVVFGPVGLHLVGTYFGAAQNISPPSAFYHSPTPVPFPSAPVVHPYNSITLVASDMFPPADGISVSHLTATVYGSDGLPLSGASVVFTTSHGTLTDVVVVTDDNGIATTTLESTTTVSLCAVTATVAALSAYTILNIEFVGGQPQTITMTASATTAIVESIINLDITLLDVNGNPASLVPVYMTFARGGDVSGGSYSGGTLLKTDVAGVVSVTYVTGPLVGEDTLRAFVNDNVYADVKITVTGQALTDLI